MGLSPARLGPHGVLQVALAVFCLHLLSGCAVEAAPDLLDLRQVGPSSLEAGQSLELGGSGFPERQEGRVTLEGSVFAPARAPRPVRLTFPALAESRSRVLLRLADKQLSALVDGAEHVTFRGRVDLEFDPLFPDGPLLHGERDDVVLDLFQRSATLGAPGGPSFQDFLGLALDDALVVESVEPQKEAARAGLLPGDHLLALDGLRLGGARDFYPAAGLDVSSLEFERAGRGGNGSALLDRSAYQPLAGGAAARALVLLVALALALLVAARPPSSIVWLFRGRRRGGLGEFAQPPATPPLGRAEYLAFLFVVVALWLCQSAATATLRAGWLPWLGFDLELALCLASACTLLSTFLLGGRRRASRKGTFSFWRGTQSALGAACLLLPMLLAAVVRASEMGSLCLADLSHAQGGGAWAFALFESPWTLLLGLAAWGSLVPRGGFRSPLAAASPEAGGFTRSLASLGLVLFVGVWVVLFLGGIEGPRVGSVWGGFWFSAKTAVVLTSVRTLSARLAELRSVESLRFFGPAVFACSLAGLLLFGISSYSHIFEAHYELLRFGVAALLGAIVVLLGLSASRALGHGGRSADPWI